MYSWLQRGSGASNFNLFWRRADGTGDAQRLASSPYTQTPGSWHPSGKFLAFSQVVGTTSDLMLLVMDGDESSGWKPGKVAALLVTPAREWNPAFSPDGRWLAYVSDESGTNEVYVRSFPGLSGKWLISTGGGNNPVWSRTRKELVYNAADFTPLIGRRIMVVSYNASADSFAPDKPRPWSDVRLAPRPRGVANVTGSRSTCIRTASASPSSRAPRPRAPRTRSSCSFSTSWTSCGAWRRQRNDQRRPAQLFDQGLRPSGSVNSFAFSGAASCAVPSFHDGIGALPGG